MLTAGLFLLALLSKTVTCSMPAAILLLLWWKRGRIRRGEVLMLIPLFAAGLLLALNTAWLEKHHVGALGKDWDLSFLERCLLAGRALWFYAGKLLWPTRLTFIYPRWRINSAAWWQYLFPLSAAAMIVLLWLARKRLGRGPLAAALFFAGTLVPALGFFNVYPMRHSYVADHFQYLAGAGLIALCVAGVSTSCRPLSAKGRRVTFAACGVLLLTLGTLTWQQARIYRDRETLWRDTIEKNPNCAMAWHNLGGLLNQQHRLDEALAVLQPAAERFPGHPGIRNNIGTACFRRGVMLKEQGAAEPARKWFLNALEHFDRAAQLSTGHAAAYINLGNCYLELNEYRKAEEMYRKGLEIFPEFPKGLCNYARLCIAQKRPRRALDLYQKAANLDPDIPGIFVEIASLQEVLAEGRAE